MEITNKSQQPDKRMIRRIIAIREESDLWKRFAALIQSFLMRKRSQQSIRLK